MEKVLEETAEKTPPKLDNSDAILPNLRFRDQLKKPKIPMPEIKEEPDSSEDEEILSGKKRDRDYHFSDPILLEGQVLYRMTARNKALIRYVTQKLIETELEMKVPDLIDISED